MSDTSLHRYYTHYSELPVSMRILYTAALCIIGMGYLFALIYLFHTYSGRDGNPMDLTYNDLVIAYTGSGKGSKLESAMRGPMSAMLPKDEAAALINWVQQGADRPTYETFIVRGDPAVKADVLMMLNRIVPWEADYKHQEGNSPAHVKATLVGSSETVLLSKGRLLLGTWQRIFFCEFDGPRTRQILLQVSSC